MDPVSTGRRSQGLAHFIDRSVAGQLAQIDFDAGYAERDDFGDFLRPAGVRDIILN